MLKQFQIAANMTPNFYIVALTKISIHMTVKLIELQGVGQERW